ncbi:class I SAM-dependent methyltransferase [Streptomyces sp. NPDC054863]
MPVAEKSVQESTGAQKKAEVFLRSGARAVLPDLPDLTGMTERELSELPPLPFGDAEFSSRLLRAQLDPSTTDSSRPPAVIARQLDWLYALTPRPRAVHHPLCGPGNYASALHARGVERYLGVDAGPAVIEHAAERFADTPHYDFLRADISQTELLPPDREFDTLLLTYDAANFFSPQRLAELLPPLLERLRDDGTAVFDLLLAEDGSTGFDEGRQVLRRPHGSVFRTGPHLLLSESFVHPGGRVLGHRMIALAEDGTQAAQILHSVLHVLPLDEFRSLLASLGLVVDLVGRPFAGDPDPNLARHLVVARKGRTAPHPRKQP